MTLFPSTQKTGGKWVWPFVLVQEQRKQINKQLCLLSILLAFISFDLPKIFPILQSGKLSLKKVEHLYRLHSHSGVGTGFTLTPARFKGPCCLGLCTFQGDLGSWTVFHFTKMKFLLFSFKMKGFFSSIHKKNKKKERKLPMTNGKNNPTLCWLAKGPIVWARLWKRAREILMDSNHSTHSYLCFSEVNLGPPAAQNITLATVPTIGIQIAERVEALESYQPY